MQPRPPPTPNHPHHQCGPHCSVEPLFGNAYRCVTSGLVHICDRNCDQRVPYDRYSTICVVSKRLGPPAGGGLTGDMVDDGGAAAAAARKRASDSVAVAAAATQEGAAQMMMMQMHQQQHQGSSKRGRISAGHENNDAAFVAAP